MSARADGAMRAARAIVLAALAALAAFAAFPAAAATDAELRTRAQAIEVDLLAFPKRMVADLDTLAPQARTALPETRHFVDALRGQALVHAGRTDEALALAGQLEEEGAQMHDEVPTAIALLIRAEGEAKAGDEARVNLLANEARSMVANADDRYVKFWAALTVGASARMLGRSDEALASLQEAHALADAAQNSYRRANATYWLSVLHLYLKQPQVALEEARTTFAQAKLAHSTFGMVKGKAAESAALEVLNRPAEELAAMREGLAIAREAHSEVTEAFALINLADIYLRAKDFQAAYDVSAQSLTLAQQLNDRQWIAISKANMGFALFGLGRYDAGKALAEEALAEYERAGASAEIALLLGEFAGYLAEAGDYREALALRDRQQKVLDRIAVAIREHAVLEMQKNFEAERRIRAIEFQHRQTEQRFLWVLAAVFALAFAIVTLLYRTVRRTNRLLAQKNAELGLQSSHDPLTALYNRRHFQNFINQVPPDEDRRSAVAAPVRAILLIDVDHFKLINDRFGHAIGDAVLIAVARRLKDALRETDMIVRWGGEEFLVYVSFAPADRIDEIVLRIMHVVAAVPISVMGTDLRVTVSVGYSPLLLPPDNTALGWERVLGLADKALYMAKRRGRNRAYGVVCVRKAGPEAQAAIEADLEAAWRDGLVEMRELLGTGGDVAVVPDTVDAEVPASD